MGTTALGQYLRSLCNNTHWNYAVFWKLNHRTPFILTWEDGYYDHPKPTKIVGTASDNIYFNGAKSLPFSSCETSMDDYASVGCPIGLSLTNMSSLQFALGERIKPQGFDLGGIFLENPLNHLMPPSVLKLWLVIINLSVGEVAYTRKHRWVFSNSFFPGESDLELVPDDEWLLQFALGVKTILLVPVLPDGVLQLGSLEVVAEDLDVVVSVKDSFSSIRNVMDKAVPFMLKSNIVHHQSSLSPLSRLVEDMDEPLIENIDEPSGLLSTLKAEKSEDVDSIRVEENRYSTLKQWVPVPTVQDMLLLSGKGIPEESTLPSQSSQLEMLDSKMFELSCLQEELQAYTSSSGYNMELFGESFNGVDSFSVGDIKAELFGDYNTYDGSYRIVDNLLSFPEDCELHKALGPAFPIKTSDQPWDSSFFVQDSCKSSSLICNKDFVDTTQAPQVTTTSDTKFMLESVVANLCSIADDSSSNLSDGVWSYTSSSRQFNTSQPQMLSSTSPWMKNIPEAGSLDASSFLARDKTSSSFNSTINPLPDKEMQVKDYSYMHPRKGQKLNVKTSRVRNGNNPKPRPRDRQLIQDRVKELRELVPNGSKCSIDGLLDHTIKHMLYLRCVTDQAEKLKRYKNQETTSRKNLESSGNEKSFQNGTSLAFEFGSETRVCPIVVEDLEYPGHMLIEMQCDGHGHFLEITQVIRRLELTIVKGVMENRSDSTWAHFVIEAPKGFHRMDIFWPLLHLLQRRRNPISSKI